MCGIVGYVGSKNCVSTLIDQLLKLEYRGYDSAGVAVVDGGTLNVSRSVGKIRELSAILESSPLEGATGIAHTRWATHGPPSTRNAHPHVDCTGDIAVVHNGIVENYIDLRMELQSKGHLFKSQTDTEVIPHLIEDCYDGDLLEAVRNAVCRLEGSYALGVVSKHEPGRLIAVRQDSPLVIGIGEGVMYIASDIPALIADTRKIIALEDGDIASITRDRAEIFSVKGGRVERPLLEVTWDVSAAEKCGYDHFMLKEIHDEPAAVQDTLRGRLTSDNTVQLEEIELTDEQVRNFDRIYIVACGTAYYAGCVGKYFIEKLIGTPVEVEMASEFRYREPVLDAGTLVVCISQSGETADTLAALRMAKKCGAATVGLINVVGSTMSREADNVLYTRAGPEICVASTKAYISQLIALYLLGLFLAGKKKTAAPEEIEKYVQSLRELPDLITRVLEDEQEIAQIAEEVADTSDCFYLGRGLDFAVSLEGALKLKEISYIHAEAYAAGEMKHGPLALITKGTTVFCLVTQDHVRDKMISNIREVQARRGRVIAVAVEKDPDTHQVADYTIHIPRTDQMFTPVLSVIPLQMLAYFTARSLDRDIDQPRNLAKSVTVE